MAKEIVSDGESFEIFGLDAQFGGKRTSIAKASCENGVSAFDFGVVPTVNGKAVVVNNSTATNFSVRPTVATKPVLVGSAILPVVSLGAAAAGPITATGAKVGDVVSLAYNITDGTLDTAAFETTVTVANQIQQTSASNLSAKNYLFLVLRQS